MGNITKFNGRVDALNKNVNIWNLPPPHICYICYQLIIRQGTSQYGLSYKYFVLPSTNTLLLPNSSLYPLNYALDIYLLSKHICTLSTYIHTYTLLAHMKLDLMRATMNHIHSHIPLYHFTISCNIKACVYSCKFRASSTKLRHCYPPQQAILNFNSSPTQFC